MKPNSALKMKHVLWASVGLLLAIALVAVTHSGAKPATQGPPAPVVEVAQVEQSVNGVQRA